MNLKELMNHPILHKLPPEEFKAFLLLSYKSKNGVIHNFTIRGLVREWSENPEINMPTSKNKVKEIIRNLENLNLISYIKEKETLIISKDDL